MSKELEQQITNIKDAIAKLEKKLNGTLWMSSISQHDIQEKIVQHSIELATLYKNNLQFDEALIQLKKAYDYYTNPSKKSLDLNQSTHKCIEILDLQVKCSKSNENQKQQKQFLAELLIKLPLTNYSKYKKDIFKYLSEYVALSPDYEGLSKISYIIELLDKDSLSESNTYKYVLNLKADLLCDLSDFKSAFETYVVLSEHYECLKKSKLYSLSNLSDEELTVYLKIYSLSCLHAFSMDKKVLKMIENHHQKNIMNSVDYEVRFESISNQHDEDLLSKIALLYQHSNITPPKWFPKHTIQQLNMHSYFPNITHIEKTDNHAQSRLNKIKEDKNITVMNEIDAVPEHEKIKEKITLGWEQHGVGGYKIQIQELVERLFIPRIT